MESPTSTQTSDLPPRPENLWWHGLIMLVLVLLIQLAQTILGVCAIFQFFWMMIAKERNAALAGFGDGIANWLGMAARFVTGRSDDRPFPWTPWK